MSLAKSAASVTSLLMAGLFFVAPAAQATTQYWSNNGTTLGGNGTWDTANGRWSESNAAPFSGVWANGSNDTARFASTVGTVTLGENITVGGLRFDTTGYTIANSPFTLAFGATDNPITLNGIAAATITGAVGGTGNVTLTALSPTTAGTLTLNGTSTGGWSGTTTNNNGMTLALSGLNQGLLNTTGITLNGGGITLTSADSDAEMVLNRVNNSAGITANGGTITYTTTTAASTRNFAETIGSVDLISGQLNIVETLNKTLGSQTLTLSGLTRTGAGNSSAITFSSTALGASARNSIIITGHANSAVGEIIGPWATYGSTAAAQTDYATYNRTGGGAVNAFGIQNANIAASTEDTWGTSGANVTLSGATTLTATRTVNSLRYTGGALALVLGASNFNLETYGVLNGGSGTLTISTTGTGALTTPTGGGNLYLTSGSSGIAVSAPIKNNGADAVTLVAGGSGTLTLSSTASITGGITINAGTLQFTTVAQSFTGGVTINNGGILALNSTLGLNMLNNNAITVNGSATFNAMNTTSSTGGITLNPGSILTIANNTYSYTTSGAVTGAGGIVIGQAGGGGTSVAFNSTGNTFTGGIDYTTAASGGTLTVNSFADSASLGAGNIRFGMGVAAIAHTFTYGSGAIVPLTLTNRQFDIQGSTGNNFPTINNNSSQAFTINSALLANGTGTRTLTLGGTGAGLSTFGGVIANGSLTTLSITKAGTGTWVLSGNNTFTGGIANSGGTLILSGLNETVGQTVFSGTSTTIVNTVKNFGTASSLGKGTSGTTIVIGAFSTAASLIYNGSGDTTDRTFTLQSYTSAANSAAIYNNGTGALIFSAPAWNALGAGNGKTYPFDPRRHLYRWSQ